MMKHPAHQINHIAALPQEVRLERVGADTLSSCQPAWETLARQAAEPNPFFEPWMYLPAVEQLPETHDMDYVLAFHHDTLIGFLPLEKVTGYAHLPVSYHRTGLHRHCFLGTPLVQAGYEEAFFAAIATQTASAGLGGAFVQFRLLRQDGPLAQALFRLSGSRGYAAATWHRASLRSNLAYEQYLLANIRGKKRKEWRRLTNRLSEEGEIAFRVLERESELEDWGDTFLKLEHEGWRGHGGSSLLAEEQGASYLHAILKGAFKSDQLFFMRLDVDAKCVAMLINFTVGQEGWSFKIAHDPAYARYSPGVMVELELMRQTLDEKKFSGIDSCAQEDHPMIDHLWAERDKLCHWNMPLPGMQNRAALAACRFLETTADRTRGMLGTKGVSA